MPGSKNQQKALSYPQSAREEEFLSDFLNSDRPLIYGYLNYPRFSAPNGTRESPKGIAVRLLHKTANLLGIPTERLRGVQCEWNSITTQINKDDVSVIIDPVIPTHERGQIRVLPYCSVHCFHIIYHQRYREDIQRTLRAVWEVECGDARAILLDFFGRLVSLSTNLTVGRGLYDDDILNLIGAQHDRFELNSDPIAAIARAAREGALVVTDQAFAQEAKKALDSQRNFAFSVADIFEYAPQEVQALLSHVPAGFAVSRNSPLGPIFDRLNLPKIYEGLITEDSLALDERPIGIQPISMDDYENPLAWNPFMRALLLYRTPGKGAATSEGIISTDHEEQLGRRKPLLGHDARERNALFREGEEALTSLLPSPQPSIHKRDMYRAVFREDKEGLSFFLRLIDEGVIDVRSISEQFDAKSATLLITGWLNFGLATLQGEVLMPTDRAAEIVQELTEGQG